LTQAAAKAEPDHATIGRGFHEIQGQLEHSAGQVAATAQEVDQERANAGDGVKILLQWFQISEMHHRQAALKLRDDIDSRGGNANYALYLIPQ
jgi:hypothetical protein